MMSDNAKEDFEFEEDFVDLSDSDDELDEMIGGTLFDCETSEDDEDEDSWTSTKSKFDTIKVVDTINPLLKESYFKIKINKRTKFLHKQSACWIRSKNIA